MTIVQNRLHDGLARQALEHRPHYVTKIMDMGEHKEVLSSEDVYGSGLARSKTPDH
jgi:hypothetical protein